MFFQTLRKKINLKISLIQRFFINIFYPIIKFFFVNRFFIKLSNKLLFLVSSESIKNVNYSDFYFPQQKLLPEESKLFMKGKVNIQILLPVKNIKQIWKSNKN